MSMLMELWVMVMVMVVVIVVKISIVEENGGEGWIKCKGLALLQGNGQETRAFGPGKPRGPFQHLLHV